MPKQDERVNPIKFHADESTIYELDFDRESALTAQQSRIPLDDLANQPRVVIEKLFYHAFRKNHRSISKNRTDALLKERGGLKPSEIERLMLLYQQASYEGLICEEGTELKNPNMTMELE
jgi:hypothetical protein